MLLTPTQGRPLSGDEQLAFAAHVAEAYRVDDAIGRGGWGVVYAAHDLRHDRKVAIKLLRREFVGSVSVERFRREIDFLERLDHPNIVPLFDSGEFKGAPWYAMSFAEGETLRERLRRERQLPIDEAIRVARAVGEALAHAHSMGVVHRDVKPGNILLHDGLVLIADFGIARAIARSADQEMLSSTGVIVGTPTYASPEQANASPDLDGRSDIYSLGCVLYEMLAGDPPFIGSTPGGIAARHLLDPVPSLTTVRSSIGRALTDVVYKALAKSPADRFATAGEFIEVLDAAQLEPSISVVADRRRAGRWRRAGIAGVTVAVLAAGTWTVRERSVATADARAITAADTNRVAVFPFDASGSRANPADADQSMRQALLRWNGLEVVDPFALKEAMGGRASISASAARTLALSLHAGRYIRGTLTRDGAQWRAHAMLFDVSKGETPLAEATGTTTDVASLVSVFDRVANGLLFRPSDSMALASSGPGTSSLPARQAYLRGQAAMEKWNLGAADTAFAMATQFDAHYASASLWLALARVWANKDTATWHYAAAAAEAGRAALSASEQAKVDAVSLLRSGDRPAACKAWDRTTESDRFDFAGWYGAGHCLEGDRFVLRDARSASGLRFRSGLHSALVRYRRAFELRPAVLSALRDDAFLKVRQLLWTSGMDVRTGINKEQKPQYYAAFPSWQDDTLAFIPFPIEVMGSSDPVVLARLPRTVGVAVRRQRQAFRDITAGWVASQPRSAVAREALAVSLLQLGEPAAIDTIISARALVADRRELQRVRATEVWLRVQIALPGDLSSLRQARILADSLLREEDASSPDPHTLASIAALTGHAFETERIERTLPVELLVSELTPVKQASRSLVVFAAFGGPKDSLIAMERRIDSLIAQSIPIDRRQQLRANAFRRAGVLAFPDIALPSVTTLGVSHFYLLDADAALRRGDTTAVRRMLADVTRARRAFVLPEITIDAIYPEAWLVAATGDTKGAIAWIDAALSTLRVSSTLVDPVRAAMLVRAMAFRAELAQSVGDAKTAKVWASAVVVLWGDADEFLQPLVRRMRQLAR